ncbi:MAG: hypothetical protein IKH57_17130, partial [Clostridia bacterium]|nr:hypothetical protein [Clostridia bacterium]
MYKKNSFRCFLLLVVFVFLLVSCDKGNAAENTEETAHYSINIIDSKETKLEKSETESELDLQSLPASMIRILYYRNLLIANTIDY